MSFPYDRPLASMWHRLRHRPLDLYVLYRALAATWPFMAIQYLFLQAHGLSLSEIFDLNVVFSLATVCLEVPTGIFADRRGRRTAMALGGFVMTGTCVLFVVARGFWMYALANAMSALAMTLVSGADSAYLFDHLAQTRTTSQYARYEGLSTAAKGIGNFVAALLSGLIFTVSPAGVFVFTGMLTALAGGIALLLPERHHVPRDGSALDDLQRAWRTLRAHRRLQVVLAFGAITFVLLRISLLADQPHLELHLPRMTGRQLGVAATLLASGKEIGTAAIAALSGTIIWRFRTAITAPALVLLIVGTYAGMSLGVAAPDIVMMVLLSSLFGLFSPLMRALMNRWIPTSRDRATLLSFESMGRRLLFAAVSPLFGHAAESSSLHATFGGTAWVAVGVYAALAALAVRRFGASAFERASAPRISHAAPSALASTGA